MIKKIIATFLGTVIFATTAHAAHSTYSPMSPRQISVKASHSDYSYGLSVLPGNSLDSLEKLNRGLPWHANYYVLDRYMLRPVAHGYAKLPSFVRTGVHNFFSNISDLVSTPNNLFVGEFKDSGKSIARFSINSTIGILGLFDVASSFGIEEKKMALDTVLGKGGVDQGAYFMIPGLGPQTERSVHADTVDSWPFMLVDPITGFVLRGVKVIDTRAGLIAQEELIDTAVDPYAQMRTAILMYAEGKVNPDASTENKKDENVESFLDEIDE